MFSESHFRRELIQWGYVAFISTALALTSITAASASTSSDGDRNQTKAGSAPSNALRYGK